MLGTGFESFVSDGSNVGSNVGSFVSSCLWTVRLSGSEETVLLRVSFVFEDKSTWLVGEDVCVVSLRWLTVLVREK